MRRICVLLALAVAALFGVGAAEAQEVSDPPQYLAKPLEMPEAKAPGYWVVWFTTYSDEASTRSELWSWDLGTGRIAQVGTIRYGRANGITINKRGEMYIIAQDRNSDDMLVQINPDNGNVIRVLYLTPDNNYSSLEAVGNQIYTTEDDDRELWKIRVNTGKVQNMTSVNDDAADGTAMHIRGRFARIFDGTGDYGSGNCPGCAGETRLNKKTGELARTRPLLFETPVFECTDRSGNCGINAVTDCGKSTFMGVSLSYDGGPSHLAQLVGREVRSIFGPLGHIEGMHCQWVPE